MQGKSCLAETTPVAHHFSMDPFSKTLESVLVANKTTATQVCAASGLTQPYLSNLLAGRREIGPKTFSALLGAFEKKGHQRQLVVAYLEQVLREVNSHDADAKNHWTIAQLLRGTQTSAEAITPLWLEQLVEEAVVEGDSEPEVLLLIQDLLQAVLKFKKAKPKKGKA